MSSLIALSLCQKNLDFDPEIAWHPLLPAYCYKNELLCAFERSSGTAVSLNAESLPTALKALYPELGFFELARLSQKLPAEHETQSLLWSLYGYHWRDQLSLTVEKVVRLPRPIQSWLQTKKLGPQDLAVLRSVTDLGLLDEFWPLLTRSSLSKSEITQVLELFIELRLMGHSFEALTPVEGSSWVKQLKEQRYPCSLQKDQEAEQFLRAVAWPHKSEARWVRRGDRSGVELKLFFGHPQELQRAVQRLEQVCEDLKESSNLEELWSRN